MKDYRKPADTADKKTLQDEEFRQLKQELENEKKKIVEVFERAPAFMAMLHGKDHVFEMVNKSYYQLIGHRDIINKSVKDALPEVVNQGFIEILDGVLKTGKPYIGNEVPILLQRKKHSKPEERYVNFVYEPIKDIKGKRTGIVAHGYDVTDQVVARKMAQESEKLFKTYAEAMPQMAFIADAKGNIIYFNQRWYDYVRGIEGTEGWGWRDKNIHHPDDLQRAIDTWNESLKTGKPYEIEYRLRRYDGEYRWHLGRAIPLCDESGEIIQWLGTNTDVHEQKQMQQQRDDFMGVVSHELKTPVTSIKAFTQVMQARFQRAGDEKSTELLGKMDAQINKLTKLIGDLLDITKIDGGKLQFNEDHFAFDDLVIEVAEEIQRTTSKHVIKLKGKTGKTIYGDKDRISQVITNLLTNAIKYSPHSEKIVVTMKSTSKEVTACVQDYGVGIPKEKQFQVFERFYRVSGSTQYDTIPGIGLGLYISAEIIKRQNGTLWVDSDEGKGSTFCFRLPIAKQTVSQQTDPLAKERTKHE